MRKLALLVLVACTHLVPAAAPADAPAADAASIPPDAPTAGRYVVHETFDAMATGAAPAGFATSGAVTVREVPFAADKSVELAGVARLQRAFPAQQGRVVFEAKVLARDTVGFKAIPYVYDASGAAVASIAFQDGNLIAHVGATITTVEPIAANTWYRVRVVVDTSAGTFDLFVDGVRKLAGQALRTASPRVASLAYYLDGANAGTLLVDNVKVYTEAAFIGAPPQPVFDARAYGAVGDGTTNDTAAIQRAIDAAAGTGGSVVLAHGTFLAGTLVLRSKLTFFIDSSATLLGSTDPAAYPTQHPATGNTQLSNCQRALLYAEGATDLAFDGGGTIDGQGAAFHGPEATRPILLWSVLGDRVAVRNLYLEQGAVWSLVQMETDHVALANLDVQSDGITHDGIDIVDGNDIAIDDVAVRSGDDAMCLKTGVRRGITNLTVTHSLFAGSDGGSNGIKLGTASYGAFQHLTFEDDYIKDVQYAAMAVESRQGADIAHVAFRRIELANTGAAFFVYLAQQATTHPAGDVPKLGSIDDVSFTDILGRTASWPHSPHQGSLITGHLYAGAVYPITNLAFTNVDVTFTGGLASVPAAPPEAVPDQYPESNMFGDLPAWGYYLRHVAGVTFANCHATAAAVDARAALVTDDASGILGGVTPARRDTRGRARVPSLREPSAPSRSIRTLDAGDPPRSGCCSTTRTSRFRTSRRWSSVAPAAPTGRSEPRGSLLHAPIGSTRRSSPPRCDRAPGCALGRARCARRYCTTPAR